MNVDVWTCAICNTVMLTEHAAVAHECGVEPAVEVLADAPMSTREAVMVLANQLANIVGQLAEIKSAVDANSHQVEQVRDMLDTFTEFPIRVKVAD